MHFRKRLAIIVIRQLLEEDQDQIAEDLSINENATYDFYHLVEIETKDRDAKSILKCIRYLDQPDRKEKRQTVAQAVVPTTSGNILYPNPGT